MLREKISKKENLYAKYVGVFARFLLVITGIMLGLQTAHSTHLPIVNCSIVDCTSTDHQNILNHSMFNENNFDIIVDGLGRTRKFWVHIPPNYDTLSNEQKMPVIFAFHGYGQTHESMLTGKWGDFFDQDIAFVIPLADFEPCNTSAIPGRVWMGPGWIAGVPIGTALPANCDPATQQVDIFGNPVTYFDASIPDTFTDVLFIENLRSIILSSFPKLNANKVYATGFSNGGGFTYALLCYRSSLFRGFSVVSNTLFDEGKRGDYDNNGIEDIDENSLIATCGKSQWDSGHATGISSPNLWGFGRIQLPPPSNTSLLIRKTKPIALFVADHDHYSQQEIDDTSSEIRARNNLGNLAFGFYPYSDLQADDAITKLSTTNSPRIAAYTYSAFRKYFVERTGPLPSAGHAMPDAEECPVLGGSEKMTCDYSYTSETKAFFENHADLNLNP